MIPRMICMGSAARAEIMHLLSKRTKYAQFFSSDRDILRNIVMARGSLSLLETEDLIINGKVLVKLKKEKKVDLKLSIDADIKVDGKDLPIVPTLALYHKPVGVHCTMKDNWGRECLDKLQLSWPFLKYMHPVVRK